MEENYAVEVDQLLGEFFYGCNIPFVTVESECFKNLIKKLNPSYVLPSRKVLATSMLDACYTKLLQSVCQVNTKDAVLILDGWKNSAANTKLIVAMLKLNNVDKKKYVYLNYENFSDINETAENLRNFVNKCIEIARNKFNLNIYCVTTDNAANMLRMGKLVNIWHTTCNSHSSNLLCKSLIDNEFAAKTNSLIKDFKHPAMEARLLQRRGNRMKLIAQTRWSSHRDSFRRCLQNLEVMRQIVQEEEQNTLSDDTCNLLFSHDFEIKLQDSILLLDPVCELTNICQAADCSLATACELWLKLELPANNANIQKIIEDRKIKALNIYGFAANFLHNIYEGLRFQRDERIKEKVHQFFRENLNEEGLLELDKYTNKAEMFHNLFSKNYESPLIFWRAAQWFYPTLSNLAMKLLNLSASTAQLERLFSEWSHVHSFRRNRLKPERSAKLVALYYDLKLNDSNLIEVLNKENENNEL